MNINMNNNNKYDQKELKKKIFSNKKVIPE